MKTLKYGSKGPLVEFLQNILKKLDIYNEEIDGIYGINTKNSVITFQKQNNILIDGIIGSNTWLKLKPYINGALGFIIPTNINYSYSILKINLNTLKELYPFLEITSIGNSILGNELPVIKLGNGPKEVFYSASYHANEWLTSPVLMKFLADFCYCYVNNLPIFGINAKTIYNSCTIYILPMVNPDGVNLVTGEISPNSSLYSNTRLIANNYPNIPFPNGWKANIRGVDLNLQFPADWEQAKQIKFSQGFTSPAPRDFVGFGPLTEPESVAVYNFTLRHNFSLILAYHTQGNVIFWQFQNYNPPNSLTIGKEFERVSSYTLQETPFSSSFAGYKDWFIQNYNKPGYTIEAGKGINPLPTSQFKKIYKDNLGILTLGTILSTN